MASIELSLEAFLPYRLNRAAAAISTRFKRVYARRYQLTTPEWRVLATVAQFGEITARDIGVHSQMHKTKVSRAVRGLAERRWLTRRENILDRREEFLVLNARGRQAYESLIPEMKRLEAQLLEDIGKEISEELQGSLTSLEGVLGLKRDPRKDPAGSNR
jgi:DNA-binding MarR family transcriptional regulator